MDDEEITIWDCPQCNGKLIRRVNRREGTRFLGCTNYPKCKYTQRDESEESRE